MGIDPFTLTAITAGLTMASSFADAQIQAKQIKKAEKTNLKAQELKAKAERQSMATELARIAGSIRVSSGERGGGSQSGSANALAASNYAQLERGYTNVHMNSYMEGHRSLGTVPNMFTTLAGGAIQGLQLGMSLNNSIYQYNTMKEMKNAKAS